MSMQRISRDVLAEKYAKGDETTIDEVLLRVATALARCEDDPERREEEFLAAMRAGFVPAGRILSAAGTDIRATLINCFVQPVGDAMRGEPGDPGIMDALAEAAETMRRSARMGVLRCDHPDIEEFVGAKDRGGRIRGVRWHWTASTSLPVRCRHRCRSLVAARHE